jgi:hypothetical protein
MIDGRFYHLESMIDGIQRIFLEGDTNKWYSEAAKRQDPESRTPEHHLFSGDIQLQTPKPKTLNPKSLNLTCSPGT